MNINEETILPVNTILYCTKYYIHGKNEWICSKDEIFRIIRYDSYDDTYLIVVDSIDDDNDLESLWLYNKYESYIKDPNNGNMAYFWDYFITKEQKADRIRDIAKSFICK